MAKTNASNQGKPISKLGAILKGKCPRCRQGKIFTHPITSLGKFEQTYTECPHCGVDFVIEPGFMWGAMYIGYAINVAVIVPSVILYVFAFPDLNPWIFVSSLAAVLVALIPINARLGRSMMLHLFSPIEYDPHYGKSIDVVNLEVNFKKASKKKQEVDQGDSQ